MKRSVEKRITRVVVSLYTPGQRTPVMRIEESGGTRLVEDVIAKLRVSVDILNDALTDGEKS